MITIALVLQPDLSPQRSLLENGLAPHAIILLWEEKVLNSQVLNSRTCFGVTFAHRAVGPGIKMVKSLPKKSKKKKSNGC